MKAVKSLHRGRFFCDVAKLSSTQFLEFFKFDLGFRQVNRKVPRPLLINSRPPAVAKSSEGYLHKITPASGVPYLIVTTGDGNIRLRCVASGKV